MGELTEPLRAALADIEGCWTVVPRDHDRASYEELCRLGLILRGARSHTHIAYCRTPAGRAALEARP